MFALTRTPRSRVPSYPLGAFIDSFFQDVNTASKLVPSLDFVETPDAYVAHAELPGIDPEAIDVSIQDGRLEIRGEKKSADEKDGETWHRVERRYGSFVRSVVLPGEVAPDGVTATSRHGVLTITLPKREDQKPRKIDVQVS